MITELERIICLYTLYPSNYNYNLKYIYIIKNIIFLDVPFILHEMQLLHKYLIVYFTVKKKVDKTNLFSQQMCSEVTKLRLSH